MSKFLHSIRQLFDGSRPTNDKLKYRIIGFGVAFVHFTFCLSFWMLEIMPLAIYNAAITAFYCFLGYIVGRMERYTTVFVSTYIEILFHSTMASLLLGWSWGFMIYTIALVPVSFYLTYTLPYFRKSIVMPFIISAIVWINYLVVRNITLGQTPRYPNVPDPVVNGFYYYNTAIVFTMLLLTSVLFSIEIRYMQRNLERENRALDKMAHFDPLTRLMNRRSITPYLEQAVRSGEKFSVIMMDIDNFKKVNDTYGHAAGDKVLISVAEIVMEDVRDKDYACRWGGEEILVLLKTGRGSAFQVAERICRDVQENNVDCGDQVISVTVTMGVAQFHSGDSVNSVIVRADEKLYYGKKHGKNQVVLQIPREH